MADNRASAPGEEGEERPGEPGAPAPPAHRPGGLLRVLRHRDFALFWWAQIFSLVGTWMQAYAQGYVVASLTSNPVPLGLVNFAMSLPTLLLMPFGGVVADRSERRRILIYTQWGMLLLAAAMGLLVAADRLQLWHVYLLAVPLGIATAYELPAYQSFYPQLVAREDLPQAISLNQATFHGSRIIGPGIAAAIVYKWGAAAAFFANAASFLPVLLVLARIRPPQAAASGPADARSMLVEGLRYVRERPQLQALLGLTGLTTFFIFPNLAILTPYYALHVLQVGPGGLGTLMSVSGAGSLLGAALLLTVPPERRVARIGFGTATILLTMSILAWSEDLWLSAGVMTLQSVALAHSLGLVSIIIQEEVPDALRGRVMSLYSLMFTGIMPFAALAIPALADRIGMRLELQIAGVLYTLGGLFLVARLRATASRT